MLTVTAGSAWFHTALPVFVVGLVLLGGLVATEWRRWTPQERFGFANWITAVRAGLLGFLPVALSAGTGIFIGACFLILALDGLDGWLARRHTLSSEFGAFFDKETDALFLLLLCTLASFRGPLPVWILGAGLLRYGFVVVLFLLPGSEKTEPRSTMARYVYGLMVGALLTSFLPYPALYQPLVAVATTALLFSFGCTLWRIVPQRWALGRS